MLGCLSLCFDSSKFKPKCWIRVLSIHIKRGDSILFSRHGLAIARTHILNE